MPLVASLLLLVVTQSRDSTAPYSHGAAPEIHAVRDFDALVHAPVDNILAVKVSYWIGL